MELGICVRDLPVTEVVDLARFAEDTGFRELWLPEASGRDPFVSIGAAFAVTQRIRLGVGVVAAIFHRPDRIALAAATLAEQSGGRFDLGLGVSHREAARQAGAEFPSSPLRFVRDYLASVRATVDALSFGGELPILVGALGERMVHLGASETDGVVLNWLTPAALGDTVQRVRAAAPAGSTPRTVLYLRLSTADVLRADAIAYDTMVNYHQHFVAQGLGGVDAADPADPDAVVAGTCLAVDDIGAAKDRLAAYAESGVDVVALYPHGLDPATRRRALEAIAG